MKIALIGYGKMGKEIEKAAFRRGHEIFLTVDIGNQEDLTKENLQACDIAIEFTTPETAVGNYLKCLEAGIPVVSGTTGWLDRKDEVENRFRKAGGTFFYASNFSVGVNLFFALNKKLAALMASHSQYDVHIREVHHTQKKDAPSGTAISLAEDLLPILPGKKSWVNHRTDEKQKIPILSERRGEIPGIHTVCYDSDVDTLEITHSAKSREGFALGSVLAAEYCLKHAGILSMNDLLNI
jgi:4-hydroxy-tetrahydrodipicolinate reductase